MHCPSPSSSVDTLTSRHIVSTTTPPIAPPSQYSTGHRVSIPDLAGGSVSREESLNNFSSDINSHMVPQGEMMMSSMSMSGSQHTTITPAQHQTMVLWVIFMMTIKLSLIKISSHGSVVTSVVMPPVPSPGQHVLLSAKMDPDTDASYGVSLARLDNTLSRKQGNGIFFRWTFFSEKYLIITSQHHHHNLNINGDTLNIFNLNAA